MKQIFTILVALLATTNLWAGWVDFEVDGISYYILSDEEPYTVAVTHEYIFDFNDTNYEGVTTISIPSHVTSDGITYTVVGIDDLAFESCGSLTAVAIPNTVTSIGSEAFIGCTSLNIITIPQNVMSIGANAFSNTGYANNSANWEDNLLYIDDCLISVKESESIVNVKESTRLIADAAFEGCKSLTSITIPNRVTNIGNRAFEGCSSLTSITIPNSVESIGHEAFYHCTSLTSITIPNRVTSIGNRAFEGCSSLTSIAIPNSVTSIGDWAFYYCRSLTSITIPNSVTSIGWRAFEEINLTSFICYSPSLTSFGTYLNTQPQLDTIVAPAAFFDVEEADWASAPKHVRYARVIAGELTENAFGVINRSYKTLKVLDLEAATNTSIADEAFKGCYNLDSLYLPSNLTYIPYMAVADCKSLKSITIPATVEEIDNSAFENCRSLQSTIFEGSAPAQGPAHYAAASGSSLWRIGSWAFYNCHQLQELTIPEGVTEIGDAAFYGCTYLEDMVLPSTIQAIGDNGFALCAKLQKIHVKATTPPSIQAKTFFDVNRQIPVYVPDGAVEAYEDDPYWQEFDIQCNSSTPTAVEDVTAYGNGIQKLIRDGQLIIVRGGKSYSVMGQEL